MLASYSYCITSNRSQKFIPFLAPKTQHLMSNVSNQGKVFVSKYVVTPCF